MQLFYCVFQDEDESDMSISEEECDDDDEDDIWKAGGQEEQDEEHSNANMPETQQENRVIIFICRLLMYFQVVHGLSDRVLQSLLHVLFAILTEIAKISESLRNLSAAFPSTLYRLRKAIGINRDNFIKHVMCPKCGELYSFSAIVGQSRIEKCKKTWVTSSSPNRVTKTCNANLVKEVRVINNKNNVTTKIYPLKTFCYNNLLEALKIMIKRPNFLKTCNDWKRRMSRSDYMTDVYDGEIWQHFFGDDGEFPSENYLGFLLNVDWFQPYQRRSTSIGAMYLTCLNLPRELRYKRCNIVVLGIIPSLEDGKETSSINPLLKPIVDDLDKLFDGVTFDTTEGTKNVTVYLSVAAVTSPRIENCVGSLAILRN